MKRRWGSWIVVCLAVPGCNLIVGVDDFKAEGAGGGTSVTTASVGGAGGTGGGTGGAAPFCGDGLKTGVEECDGPDFGGQTCEDAGAFYDGTLGCTPGCAYDTSGCFGPPSVPQLRRPANGAYVGSAFIADTRKPKFEWSPASLPAGAPAGPIIRYELSYSIDSTFPVGNTTVIDAQAATSFQPVTDLPIQTTPPVGDRYFWRVRACVDLVCSGQSRVRNVNVARQRTDVDGDGYADALVGAPTSNADQGSAYLYLSGGAPLAGATPAQAFHNTDVNDPGLNGGLGKSVVMGDFNGDGFADPVVDGWRLYGGAAFVYFGGTDIDFTGPSDGLYVDGCCEFGNNSMGAGDVNGDGYDDLLIPDLYGPGVRIFFGPVLPAVIGDADVIIPRFTIASADPNSPWFSIQTRVAGDVNGDGYDDILITAPHEPGTTGFAYLYLGRAIFDVDPTTHVYAGPPDATLAEPNAAGNYWFGISAAGAGDLNGDGYADVVVSHAADNSVSGQVFVYFGGPGAFNTMADGAFALGTGVGHGRAAGDINGDGFDDLIIGHPYSGGGAGAAVLFFGGAGTTLNSTVDGSYQGVATENLGWALVGAGDIDGNGKADLWMGAPAAAGGGLIRAFTAAPTTPAATPSAFFLQPTDVGLGSFGHAVE